MDWTLTVRRHVEELLHAWFTRRPPFAEVVSRRFADLRQDPRRLLEEVVVPLRGHHAFRVRAGGPGSREYPRLPIRLVATFTVHVRPGDEGKGELLVVGARMGDDFDLEL